VENRPDPDAGAGSVHPYLIETYKLLTNKEDIDFKQLFPLTENPSYELRGNNRRIHKPEPEVEEKQE